MNTPAQRVATRFARMLNDGEFSQMMEWLGPKALAAHRKYPRGMREFDTNTRLFQFNIAPIDYLSMPIEQAKQMMRDGADLQDVVNRDAYLAMKSVIDAVMRRKIKFKIVKQPWDHGGSYLEAVFPMKRTP